MADLALILLIVILIALARGYVAACDRLTSGPQAIMPIPLLAVGVSDWLALVIALGLIAFLLFTLVRPERF